MADDKQFQRMDFRGLRVRLEEVKHLLDQAAIVSLAQGREKVAEMVKHARWRRGQDGHGIQRRYR